MQVELIWHRGCPNVTAARKNLMQAFSLAGVSAPRWREWCVDDEGCPEYARAFGSPSILIDGLDVAGVPAGGGPSCRLYPAEGGGFGPAPAPSAIAATMRARIEKASPANETGFSWRRIAAAAPAFAIALLPKIACPACWPAYAGVLSSLGVTFLIDARYLFALTAAFLLVALFFLGFRATRRRGFGPLALGLVASAILLIGKFHFESDPAMFSGVGLLMAASLWNSWPRKLAASPDCSARKPNAPVPSCCDTTEPLPPPDCCVSDTQGEMS